MCRGRQCRKEKETKDTTFQRLPRAVSFHPFLSAQERMPPEGMQYHKQPYCFLFAVCTTAWSDEKQTSPAENIPFLRGFGEYDSSYMREGHAPPLRCITIISAINRNLSGNELLIFAKRQLSNDSWRFADHILMFKHFFRTETDRKRQI